MRIIKWLKWQGNVEVGDKIQCPMLKNENVLTYYPKGEPCNYLYTAPFIDAFGNVVVGRYKRDEGCWDENILLVLCKRENYREGMIFEM